MLIPASPIRLPTVPTLTVPDDITVIANVARGAEPTLAAIVDFLAGATAIDIVDPEPTIADDGPTLFPLGDTDVTFTTTDAAGNQTTSVATVTVEQITGDPVIRISPTAPGGEPEPADLPSGPQPTSWSVQRSGLREIVAEFAVPIILPTAADVTLTNLGLDADNDPDTVIELRDEQISISEDGLVLTISLDPGQLGDGVYQLELAQSVTGADEFVFTGNSDNEFYGLSGDWNGSGGVNIQDFATFAYWFGQSDNAPAYVDLNNSGGINIQDFAGFAANFGSTIQYPDSSLEGEGERSLSIEDAENVIAELQSDSPAVDREGLDHNGDGSVDAADALYVINRVEIEASISQIVDGDNEDETREAIDQLLAQLNSLGTLF